LTHLYDLFACIYNVPKHNADRNGGVSVKKNGAEYRAKGLIRFLILPVSARFFSGA
jgi:hypothetical protein